MYTTSLQIKIKRTGTSLSLSENEMDSDIEVDLSLAIRQHHAHRSRSTPLTPASESHTGDQVDSIAAGSLVHFDSIVAFKDNGGVAVGSQISIRSSGGSTDFTTPYDALNIDAVVDELPLDPVVTVKKEELKAEPSLEATTTMTPVKNTATQIKEEEDLRTPTPSNINANEPAYDKDVITSNAEYSALIQSSNDAPATPTNTLTNNSAAT